MKGLLTKDFLTVKKKYGIARLIMDLAIIAALMIILEGAGSIYISFLLVPLEVASMLITLANSDEQWKWGKYAVALPLSKKQIVSSRYAFAGDCSNHRIMCCSCSKHDFLLLLSSISVWFLFVYVCSFILCCLTVPCLYTAL